MVNLGTRGKYLGIFLPESRILGGKLDEWRPLPVKRVRIDTIAPPDLNIVQADGPVPWILEAEEYKH